MEFSEEVLPDSPIPEKPGRQESKVSKAFRDFAGVETTENQEVVAFR